MTALIIGASGQVGFHIAKACRDLGITTYGTATKPNPACALQLDITNPHSVAQAFKISHPDVVFLCAALTHVDGCEKAPGLAEAINVTGTASVADYCKRCGAKLVYLSTDYVFDGNDGPYSELAIPHPINIYGKTKLAGEHIALAQADALTIRTTWVYSYIAGGNNFLMQVLSAGRVGRKLQVPFDQYSTPTHAADLAKYAVELVIRNKSGVYNVAGADCLSRYAFALKICNQFNMVSDFIEPAATYELQQTARRPLRSGLTVNKLSAEIGPMSVADSLELIKLGVYNG